MDIINCPENFFGAKLPRICIFHATLEDVTECEKYAKESPIEGTLLVSSVGDNKPDQIEWRVNAARTAHTIGTVVSDDHVSIFEAGLFTHQNAYVLGSVTPGLYAYYKAMGGMLPEEKKNVYAFLREIEAVLIMEKRK